MVRVMLVVDSTNQHDHTVVTDGAVAEQHMLAVLVSVATVADNLNHNSAA